MIKEVKLRTVGFFDLLTLLFIYLKLTNQIDWSWFWVLSPGIFGIVITTSIFVSAFIWAWENEK